MVIRYLKGETLPSQFAPGWNLVCAGSLWPWLGEGERQPVKK